ncbi:MAG: hypothetical protein ACLQU5_37045 [Isosphaeraceae bacterium]
MDRDPGLLGRQPGNRNISIVDPKRVQALARHSTITLTMDRYCKTTSKGSAKHWNGGGREK